MIGIIFAAVSLEICRNATGKSCNTGKARGTISAWQRCIEMSALAMNSVTDKKIVFISHWI